MKTTWKLIKEKQLIFQPSIPRFLQQTVSHESCPSNFIEQTPFFPRRLSVVLVVLPHFERRQTIQSAGWWMHARGVLFSLIVSGSKATN